MGEISYLPLIEDMSWSYSRIETFVDCPYRFFLKYICNCEETDKFYASYGSFMHELLEKYYTGKLSRSELKTRFLTDFSTSVRGSRPQASTVEKYIRCGAKYLGEFKPINLNVVAVEKRVDFSIDGYNFTGFIDLLGEKDGELYIVDHKSRDLRPRSKRKTPTAKDRELDDMLRQLYLYSAAVEQEYGQFPAALCFNCFRTGVFIEEPFDKDAYDETISWAIRAIEDIKSSEKFYPMIDFFACRYICGVSDDCMYDQDMREERRRNVR